MRSHGKTMLFALTLTVFLLAGAIAVIGSACMAPICGIACGAARAKTV